MIHYHMKPSLICFKIPSLTQFIYKQLRGNPTTNDQYNLFYYLGPKKMLRDHETRFCFPLICGLVQKSYPGHCTLLLVL